MKKSAIYDPLFELLFEQFGIRASLLQMDMIINASYAVNERYEEIYREVCDVKGCTIEPTSGGNCWPESGYWRICYKHSAMAREGKPQPIMKQAAIKREMRRGADGVLKNKRIKSFEEMEAFFIKANEEAVKRAERSKVNPAIMNWKAEI